MALAAGAPAAPAARPASFQTGIFDPVFLDADPAVRTQWLGQTRRLNGSVVRIDAVWSRIAPSVRPEGFTADDPAAPAYRWGSLDHAVREAHAAGLKVMLTVYGTPRWAEGPSRPASAPPGSWRPDAEAYGAFALALARRYSGSFSPDGIAPLPAVYYWQAWNEPNLSRLLSPQWVDGSGRWVASAARQYRMLLRAFSRAVRSVRRRNRVVTAGTAPYGDPPGGMRTRPLAFWRIALCSNRARCRSVPRFSFLSHHPYSVGGPLGTTYSRDDASVADMHRLARLLRRPGLRGRRLWVTEFSWDSSPPDPHGVPARRHARWVAAGLHVLYRQGVAAVLWTRVVDQEPKPSYAATNQSGLFLRTGEAKPAARAFAFPLSALRVRGRIEVWGRAPQRGTVLLQRRGRTIRRVRTRADGTFLVRLRGRGGARLRAVQGSARSVTTRPR